MNPRFNVGTTFTGKGKRICTVTDIHRTYNNAGDIVKIRYVAVHDFLGQSVTEQDVLETTIARNLIQAK